MFLFLQSPKVLPRVPEFLQTEPAAFLSMLRATYAQAAIVSWYDDVEWFFAFDIEQRVRESGRDTHE